MSGTTLQLVLHAGGFVKAILVALACCSIVSWGVILYKYLYLRAASRESRIFLRAFDAPHDLQELLGTARQLTVSPLANLFVSVCSAPLDGRPRHHPAPPGRGGVQGSAAHAGGRFDQTLGAVGTGATSAVVGTPHDALTRLKRTETAETDKLESYLIFLATTGSTAPFIGLFGTVWGIMDAFRGIGASGSASLAIVSPAIAEALIATAAGLAAAIPAVMAYNYYVNRVRKMSQELAQFSEELHALLIQRAA